MVKRASNIRLPSWASKWSSGEWRLPRMGQETGRNPSLDRVRNSLRHFTIWPRGSFWRKIFEDPPRALCDTPASRGIWRQTAWRRRPAGVLTSIWWTSTCGEGRGQKRTGNTNINHPLTASFIINIWLRNPWTPKVPCMLKDYCGKRNTVKSLDWT